ncbi:MAG: V-type ATP synthase subunit F [Christensenellales bacterium]|jgi:V/A-type H+-transporting ATPase subunit F
MYKIAVMGDKDSIYGFASIGMDVYPVSDAAQALKKLKTLCESEYAIVYIVEWLYEHIQKEAQDYCEKTLPAIIPIPGVSGNTGLGVSRIKKFVEQAVGSDILFRHE